MKVRDTWQRTSKLVEMLLKIDALLIAITLFISYILSALIVSIVRLLFDGDFVFKIYQTLDKMFKMLPPDLYNATFKHIPAFHTNKWGDQLESLMNNLGQGFLMSLIWIGLLLLIVYVISIVFRHHNGEMAPFKNDWEANKLKKQIIKDTNSRRRDKSKARNKKADTWNVFKWYFNKEVREERNIRKGDRLANKAIRGCVAIIETRIEEGQVAPQKKYYITFENPTNTEAKEKVKSKLKDLHKLLMQITKVTFDEGKDKQEHAYKVFEGSVEKELKEAKSVVKKRKQNNNSEYVNSSNNTSVQGSFEGNFPLEILDDKSNEIEQKTIEATKFADENQSRISEYLANIDLQADLTNRYIGNGSIGYKYKVRYTKVDKKSSNNIQEGLKNYLGFGSVMVNEVPAGLEINIGLIDEYSNIDKSIPIDNRKIIKESLQNAKDSTTSIFGVSVEGKVITKEIADAPHIITSGSTGSGKSVGMNYLTSSISWHANKDEIEFTFIDPKEVEFMFYKGHPFNKVDPITDYNDAYIFLKYMTYEMDDRKKKIKSVKAKNIDSYNKKAEKQGFTKMKKSIIWIDEYAELLLVVKEIEEQVNRITALGRALGIYIVLGTQRPSTDVITGVIKNNMPTRYTFALSSAVDSNTALGDAGAENLNGKGDALLKWNGSSRNIRLQGGFLEEHEVERIVDYLKNTLEPNIPVDYRARVAREEGEDEDEENSELLAATTSLNNTMQNFDKEKATEDKTVQISEDKPKKDETVKETLDPSAYIKQNDNDNQPIHSSKQKKASTKEEMTEDEMSVVEMAMQRQKSRRKKDN
ncbi:TPA: DNA translocase FtsK [Clostridioides difficile]|nr:DNA translocase FtsK [Clostridioides difficile]